MNEELPIIGNLILKLCELKQSKTKYLGNRLTEYEKCDYKIRTCIWLAIDAFQKPND